MVYINQLLNAFLVLECDCAFWTNHGLSSQVNKSTYIKWTCQISS